MYIVCGCVCTLNLTETPNKFQKLPRVDISLHLKFWRTNNALWYRRGENTGTYAHTQTIHTYLVEDGGVLFVYSAILIIGCSLLLVTQDAVQLTQHLCVCLCICAFIRVKDLGL